MTNRLLTCALVTLVALTTAHAQKTGSGNLFATNLSDNRILKWMAAAGSPVSFTCASPTNCQFNNTAGTSVYWFSGSEGLVFDTPGNLWVANNNDFNNNTNASGGSLVRIKSSLVNTNGGTINVGNATICSTALAKFSGMAKVGTDFYVNDQQQLANGTDNGRIWKLSTTTSALTNTGIRQVYLGNGQIAEAPLGVFPVVSLTATGTISVTSSQQNSNPRTRSFAYALPNNAPACNLPLVIVLHGDGGTGAGILSYTKFHTLGQSQNFITVYPDAQTVAGSVQWNKFADNALGSGDNGNDGNAPDDVQYISDLIDYFSKKFGINKSKVYVSGHSGGGFMAYFMAIANGTKSKIAGIAPVAASLWGQNTYLNTQFGASAFVPKAVLHVHATTDNVVPFPDFSSGWIWPESSFGSATCGISTPTALSAGTVDKYTFCAGNTTTTPQAKPVLLVALKATGLGHGWPSTSNGGYNTESEIWSFLSLYSQPQAATQPTVSPASVSIVAGTSTVLSASMCGNLTYRWNTGQTTASITVSSLMNTGSYSQTYSVGCYTDNNCLAGNSATAVITVTAAPTTPLIDDHIKTDQFGYLPTDQKVAVISSPDPVVSQYNQTSPFTPGSSYQLRRVSDNVSVFNGSPTAWNSGATHNQSGDKIWWFDFSSVTTPGSYYVFDVRQNKRSYSFDIGPAVYDLLARQALAALKMQRCGVARFGQLGTKIWSDGACHLGNLQDTQCRDVADPTNTSKARDMSGGWHDAGDFNKYSLYAAETLHNLLKAYEENPSAWTATAGTLPDILAEAKYELDWLLKMQDTDGGVRCKISIIGFGTNSPPSTDTRQRFYGGKSTLTTLAVSSALAHAASVFGSFTVTAPYSTTLKTAAQNAWNWAIANPNVIFSNVPFDIGGGASYNPDDGIYDDASNSYYRATSYKTVAAAYLFNAFGPTAGATYKTAFESLYASTNQMTWTTGSDTYYPDWQVVLDALVTYANNASANGSHASVIRNKFTALITTSGKLLPGYTNNTDAYRAYVDYIAWNSNQQKAQAAIQMLMLKNSNLSPASNTALSNASLGYLHYLHGLNPNAKCYLSQMNTLGADNSQNEIYHGWFDDGTVYDNALTSSVGPFPGFLIGGPNQDYSGPVAPPKNQPALKAYKDWNTGYVVATNQQEASYEITEVGIYTQAAYIRLASKFISSPTCSLVAGTAVSVQSGNWNDATTWFCGMVPGPGVVAQIKAGHTVLVSGTAQAKSVQFETGGKVQYSATGGRVVLTP
jgi:endoglucanase